MTVLGEGKNPTKEHLLALAKKFNVKRAQAMIDEVQSSLACWETVAKQCGVTRKSIDLINRFLNK